MKETSLVMSLSYIDDELISSAVNFKPSKKTWLKYVAVAAACAVLIVGVSVNFVVPHIGTHAVDPQRTGTCVELSNIDELSALCGKELLISRLDLSEMNVVENSLYYDSDSDRIETGSIRNHILRAETETMSISICSWFFGNLNSHKSDTLFTPQNTKVYNIDGVEVFVVPHPLEFLSESVYSYAIFEYDDVVYSISVQSNEPNMIIQIVECMLGH